MQATYQPQALNPALIESPSAAITAGVVRAWAPVGTSRTAVARTGVIFLIMGTSGRSKVGIAWRCALSPPGKASLP
ncbi:hypothetical protein B1L11_08080 [Microbispora sp. GKU 823]|nr:hypothetical protein B1L11_08080 [Microbispora sp. GKU 823]